MTKEVKVTIALFLTAVFMIGYCIGGCLVAEAAPDKGTMQAYAREVALQYDLAPELVLAVIETESSWKPSADNGKCAGLMQLNINTSGWIAKELGIAGNRKDYRQNIQMGCYYLNYLRDAWYQKGATDEDALYLMLLSYNRGMGGATKYVKNHSDYTKDAYCKKVIGIKWRLEGYVN